MVVIRGDGESELYTEEQERTLLKIRTQEEHRREIAPPVFVDPDLEKMERRAFAFNTILKLSLVGYLLVTALRIALKLTPSLLSAGP